MTDPQPAAVPVIQADREAGLGLFLLTRSIRPGDRHYESICAAFRTGARDDRETVQAFARHRLAERERCAKVADWRACRIYGVRTRVQNETATSIAAAIRETTDVK